MENAFIMKVKSLILTGFGINCEVETGAGFQRAGAQTDIVHINEIFSGKINIRDYDILTFPGGFSFGDDIGSGKVMANKIKFKKMPGGKTLLEELLSFKQEKYILGICNGFQILVQLGLLPDLSGDAQPEAALINNDSNRFEDRWVRVKINSANSSPFLKGIDTLELPVRHAEGKLVFKDEKTIQEVLKNNQIAMQYVDESGSPTMKYPANPNGSILSIAALTDRTGHILGMMPHPEAFLDFHNHYNWTSLKTDNKMLPRHLTGQIVFDNIVSHIMETKKSFV